LSQPRSLAQIKLNAEALAILANAFNIVLFQVGRSPNTEDDAQTHAERDCVATNAEAFANFSLGLSQPRVSSANQTQR
jgi:hypothetical protein